MPLEHSAGATPEPRTDPRRVTSLVAGGVVGAALLAFVVQNTQDVTVSWLMLSFTAPLWLVIVGVVVLSLVLAKAIGSVFRRERGRAKARSASRHA